MRNRTKPLAQPQHHFNDTLRRQGMREGAKNAHSGDFAVRGWKAPQDSKQDEGILIQETHRSGNNDVGFYCPEVKFR